MIVAMFLINLIYFLGWLILWHLTQNSDILDYGFAGMAFVLIVTYLMVDFHYWAKEREQKLLGGEL